VRETSGAARRYPAAGLCFPPASLPAAPSLRPSQSRSLAPVAASPARFPPSLAAGLVVADPFCRMGSARSASERQSAFQQATRPERVSRERAAERGGRMVGTRRRRKDERACERTRWVSRPNVQVISILYYYLPNKLIKSVLSVHYRARGSSKVSQARCSFRGISSPEGLHAGLGSTKVLCVSGAALSSGRKSTYCMWRRW
jgi:hypothetical protein